jgi:hypothetical protein
MENGVSVKQRSQTTSVKPKMRGSKLARGVKAKGVKQVGREARLRVHRITVMKPFGRRR